MALSKHYKSMIQKSRIIFRLVFLTARVATQPGSDSTANGHEKTHPGRRACRHDVVIFPYNFFSHRPRPCPGPARDRCNNRTPLKDRLNKTLSRHDSEITLDFLVGFFSDPGREPAGIRFDGQRARKKTHGPQSLPTRRYYFSILFFFAPARAVHGTSLSPMQKPHTSKRSP